MTEQEIQFFQALNGINVELVQDILSNSKLDIDQTKNEFGHPPLIIGACIADIELLELLLKYSKNINQIDDANRSSALMFVTHLGYKEIVKFLLEKGSDPNIINRDGNNVLHIAVWHGYFEIVELLLQSKVNIDCKNRHGITPLHMAAWKNYSKIIGMLIKHGAKLNPQNIDEHTPLHLASWKGNYEAVDTLIKNKVNLDALDKNDNTALHLSVKKRNNNIAELLVKNGIDISKRNREGITHTTIKNQKIDKKVKDNYDSKVINITI